MHPSQKYGNRTRKVSARSPSALKTKLDHHPLLPGRWERGNNVLKVDDRKLRFEGTASTNWGSLVFVRGSVSRDLARCLLGRLDIRTYGYKCAVQCFSRFEIVALMQVGHMFCFLDGVDKWEGSSVVTYY